MNKQFDMARYAAEIQIATLTHHNWRKGQVLFNVLYANWPEIADEVRGTDSDPFYVDGRIEDFWNWLANWEKQNGNK